MPGGEAGHGVAFEAVHEIVEPIECVHVGRWTDLRLQVSGGQHAGLMSWPDGEWLGGKLTESYDD